MDTHIWFNSPNNKIVFLIWIQFQKLFLKPSIDFVVIEDFPRDHILWKLRLWAWEPRGFIIASNLSPLGWIKLKPFPKLPVRKNRLEWI